MKDLETEEVTKKQFFNQAINLKFKKKLLNCYLQDLEIKKPTSIKDKIGHENYFT